MTIPQEHSHMVTILMTLAGAGLVGCFAATLTLDLSDNTQPRSRRMNRPPASSGSRERA